MNGMKTILLAAVFSLSAFADWTQARQELLQDLKIEDSQLAKLTALRASAQSQEAKILSQKPGSPIEAVAQQDEVVEVRREYEAQARQLLGKSNWDTIRARYFEYFGMQASERILAHVELK